MSFAENLKKLRKDNNLSQEELAEILDVSRQAVSKWEQGSGYPEVEKLLLISNKLNMSLDELMSNEVQNKPAETTQNRGFITITSPHENIIVNCYKVVSSKEYKGGKKSPKYALFGMDRGGSAFFGEPTAFLGWYANRDSLAKEIEEIHKAIQQGIPTYTLKYSVKTERKWMSVRIIEE